MEKNSQNTLKNNGHIYYEFIMDQYLDPHDPSNAKLEKNNYFNGCIGHYMTYYHCGAMCHDCGWSGCGCTTTHCCCHNHIHIPSVPESLQLVGK